jgi:hypothetical protein
MFTAAWSPTHRVWLLLRQRRSNIGTLLDERGSGVGERSRPITAFRIVTLAIRRSATLIRQHTAKQERYISQGGKEPDRADVTGDAHDVSRR